MCHLGVAEDTALVEDHNCCLAHVILCSRDYLRMQIEPVI